MSRIPAAESQDGVEESCATIEPIDEGNRELLDYLIDVAWARCLRDSYDARVNVEE